MNNSEHLYNISDTLRYLTDKVDTELRMIKSLLRKILEEMREKDQ